MLLVVGVAGVVAQVAVLMPSCPVPVHFSGTEMAHVLLTSVMIPRNPNSFLLVVQKVAFALFFAVLKPCDPFTFPLAVCEGAFLPFFTGFVVVGPAALLQPFAESAGAAQLAVGVVEVPYAVLQSILGIALHLDFSVAVPPGSKSDKRVVDVVAFEHLDAVVVELLAFPVQRVVQVTAGFADFSVGMVEGPASFPLVVQYCSFTFRPAVFVETPETAALVVHSGGGRAVVVPGVPYAGFFPLPVGPFTGFVAIGMVIGPDAVRFAVDQFPLLFLFAVFPVVDLVLWECRHAQQYH